MTTNVLLGFGMKFAKEAIAEYAMIKLLDRLETKLLAKKIQGKTPQQIAAEMRAEIEEARKAQLECTERSIPGVVKNNGEEMGAKIGALAQQHINVWARRANARIDSAEQSIVALKDVKLSQKQYDKLFGKIVDELAMDLKRSIKKYDSYMQALYAYEMMMIDMGEHSHPIIVDGKEYMMPDEIKYTSEKFQEMIHAIDALDEVGDDDAVNDMNILKHLACTLDYIFVKDEQEWRKYEDEAQTNARFVKNLEKAKRKAMDIKQGRNVENNETITQPIPLTI